VLVVGDERHVERGVDLADVVLADDRREAARHLGDAAHDEAIEADLELAPRTRVVRDHPRDEIVVGLETSGNGDGEETNTADDVLHDSAPSKSGRLAPAASGIEAPGERAFSILRANVGRARGSCTKA